jgi:hypothetical protein
VLLPSVKDPGLSGDDRDRTGYVRQGATKVGLVGTDEVTQLDHHVSTVQERKRLGELDITLGTGLALFGLSDLRELDFTLQLAP